MASGHITIDNPSYSTPVEVGTTCVINWRTYVGNSATPINKASYGGRQFSSWVTIFIAYSSSQNRNNPEYIYRAVNDRRMIVENYYDTTGEYSWSVPENLAPGIWRLYISDSKRSEITSFVDFQIIYPPVTTTTTTSWINYTEQQQAIENFLDTVSPTFSSLYRNAETLIGNAIFAYERLQNIRTRATSASTARLSGGNIDSIEASAVLNKTRSEYFTFVQKATDAIFFVANANPDADLTVKITLPLALNSITNIQELRTVLNQGLAAASSYYPPGVTPATTTTTTPTPTTTTTTTTYIMVGNTKFYSGYEITMINGVPVSTFTSSNTDAESTISTTTRALPDGSTNINEFAGIGNFSGVVER